MAFEMRRIGRQRVAYESANATNLLRYQLIVGGEKVTPDSATVTVYKPGTATAVLAATAMTVSGSILTYALDTTTVADFPIDTGYRAELAITYGGAVYPRHFMFDVVRYLLHVDVAYDQLVALDSGIAAMDHDGDTDFSAVIEAVRDEIQVMLETKAVGDDQLIETMILDPSALSIAARRKILMTVYENKGDYERAEKHEEAFSALWRPLVASIKYDTGQTGDEPADAGGIQSIRLVQ